MFDFAENVWSDWFVLPAMVMVVLEFVQITDEDVSVFAL